MAIEYTAEMTADLVERYTDVVETGADYDTRKAVVQELADELETTEASVRSKLVSEGVYVAKEKAKGVATGKSKEAYVAALRAVTGLDLRSIDKSTKVDIAALFDFIVKASEQAEADRV